MPEDAVQRLLGDEGEIVFLFVNLAPAILFTVMWVGIEKKHGQVPVPGNCARVLPLMVVPVPVHSAHIFFLGTNKKLCSD